MGSHSGKPPLPAELKPLTDSKYGGKILVDKNQTRVYQIFDLDESNYEQFSELANTRK